MEDNHVTELSTVKEKSEEKLKIIQKSVDSDAKKDIDRQIDS